MPFNYPVTLIIQNLFSFYSLLVVITLVTYCPYKALFTYLSYLRSIKLHQNYHVWHDARENLRIKRLVACRKNFFFNQIPRPKIHNRWCKSHKLWKWLGLHLAGLEISQTLLSIHLSLIDHQFRCHRLKSRFQKSWN